MVQSLSYLLDCYGKVHSQKPLRRGGFYFSSQFKGTVHRDGKVMAAGAGAAGHTACDKGAEGDGDAGHFYFSFVVHRRPHP